VVPKSFSYWTEQRGMSPLMTRGFNLSVSISFFRSISKWFNNPALEAGLFVRQVDMAS